MFAVISHIKASGGLLWWISHIKASGGLPLVETRNIFQPSGQQGLGRATQNAIEMWTCSSGRGGVSQRQDS